MTGCSGRVRRPPWGATSRFPVSLALAGALLASSPDREPGDTPGEREAIVFEPADFLHGEHERFEGETDYEIVEVDGREALHARCRESASGLWIHREVDLERTPVMEWDWRVDEPHPGEVDERTRAGDDFPARVYVMDESALFWRTRAINYVWSGAEGKGAHWPNPYRDEVRMYAVRSGAPSGEGRWKTERRNVRADFRRLHDEDVRTIDAVGLMTDCDDLETEAEAWYGTVRFVEENPS